MAKSPREAANLTISTAKAIDRELEETSSDFITEIEGLREKFMLYRSIHRELLLDEIENLLSSKEKY
ncbi:MAG: hypothetical protein KJO34_03425 [Deltaproteobacteria bacterium]|nr:hypothetical protein [Deltaproteobacteria bacterium]